MHIEKKMKETERKAAAEAAIMKNGGVVSHEALIAEGLSKTDIHRLSKAGYIKSIRRGYYSAGDNSASEEERIAAMLPDSIVYGNSALYHYGYSDYTPRVWTLAVPRNISRSRLTGTGIPMKLHYDSYYGLGKAEGDFNGITLSVYDRERTICDCIRHRDEIDSEMIPDLEDITGDPNIQVQTVQDSTQVVFKTQTLDLAEREAFAQYMSDNYGVAATDITTENISSTVSSEMRADAVIAVVIATICMLLYIWFRFKDIRFATSAIIALVHDVLVVFSFYVIARVSVGNTFIACMLTIVGYSINATIVIFDRIREELKANRKEDLKDLVNRCITQTLTRSIYTNLTTFIMVVVLYVLGVSSIKEFAAPLMVGIACGTYTSVCITGALWYVMKMRTDKAAAAASQAAAVAKHEEVKAVEDNSNGGSTVAQGSTAGKKHNKKKKRH